MAENGTRGGWAAAAARLSELVAVVPGLAGLSEPNARTAPELICRLASAIEELRRRGIRNEIQLASLQELTESLLPSGNPDQSLQTLTLYLRQILDLDEVLLLRQVPRQSRWAGYHASRSGGKRLADVAEPREAEVGRYAAVLPLSEIAGAADLPSSGEMPPLGWLCLDPAPDGSGEESWRPLEIARRVASILATLRHAEEMEAEALFRRQLLQGMHDGLLAVDRREAVVERNAAASSLLNLDDARSGVTLSELERTAPLLVGMIRSARESGADPPPREMLLASAGRPVPVRAAARALRGDASEPAGWVVNLTDLTEVRAMENEIRRLDRLAALGRFAAGVAHEIRNPLAGIEAGIDFLARKLAEDPSDQEDVRMLRSEVRRLDRIVSDLLDYTRPRPLDRQPLQVAALCDRIRHALSPLLSARGVAVSAQGPEECPLYADPDRLEQVLMNLVKNAVEATAPGGEVRLRWDGASAPGGRGVRIRVEDHGRGMSGEELARAFEPFFTTKGRGTGLGLSISQTIVEQHGGRLLLESAPDQGTTAVLELPAPESEEADAVVDSRR